MSNELIEIEVEEKRFELDQRKLKPFVSTAMIPQHLRDIGSLMILDQVSKQYGMNLLFLAQEMYIVKGKFAISGKLAISLINKSGVLDGRLKWEVRETPFGVRAYGDIDGETVYGMWIDDNLIRANGWDRNALWKTQKELMARYRSATYFARMNMPEVLMGFHTDDEVMDSFDVEAPDEEKGTLNTAIAKEVIEEAGEVKRISRATDGSIEIEYEGEIHSYEPNEERITVEGTVEYKEEEGGPLPIDKLRAKADSLGIQYRSNVSAKKLIEMIEAVEKDMK